MRCSPFPVCFALLFTVLWFLPVSGVAAGSPEDLPDRLRDTRAVNLGQILDAQFPQGQAAKGFSVEDPYGDESFDKVLAWSRVKAGQVCAVKFQPGSARLYSLRDFPTNDAASEAGFTVTHAGRCGSCSTLADLAVYLTQTDLTTPARQCARRMGLTRKKQCFVEELGFSAACAESWSYNAQHTRQACLGVCASDYGFFNLLFQRYPGENVDASGALRPCLKCDEEESGHGFRYSAGRTRRNSGIISAIERPAAALFPVDHGHYFEASEP